MSSKVGPDPRLAVRVQTAVADAVTSLKDAHAIAIAEGAKVVGNLAGQVSNVADFAGSVAETADIGATAAEGGAATLEATRFQKLLGAAKVTPGQLAKIANGLGNVSTVAGGLQAGFKSDNSTVAGKVTEGALVAGGTKLMATALSGQAALGLQATRTAAGAAKLARVGNPIMLADLALNVAGEKVLGAELHKAAGGYISGHVISTPVKLLTAWGDALVNGNHTALNKFAEDARAGEHGGAYKAALHAGQVISDKLNVVDGIEATVEAAKKVSAAWNKGVSFLTGR